MTQSKKEFTFYSTHFVYKSEIYVELDEQMRRECEEKNVVQFEKAQNEPRSIEHRAQTIAPNILWTEQMICSVEQTKENHDFFVVIWEFIAYLIDYILLFNRSTIEALLNWSDKFNAEQ